jgi:hypothetical protein
VLKRERWWIGGGFHRTMAAATSLSPNPGERVVLRWLEEDKWQGQSARAAGVLLWLRFLRGTEEGKEKGNLVAFCGQGGLVEEEMRRGGPVGRGCEKGRGVLLGGIRRLTVHEHGGGGRQSGDASRGVRCRQVGLAATVPGGGKIPISNFEI